MDLNQIIDNDRGHGPDDADFDLQTYLTDQLEQPVPDYDTGMIDHFEVINFEDTVGCRVRRKDIH